MESICYGRDIVAVHFDHFPTESPPFFRIWLDAHQVPCKAFGHYFVVIDDGDEIVEMVMGGRHSGFPHIASFDSPSPNMQNTRTRGISLRRRPMAMPTATDKPMPRGPPEDSNPGVRVISVCPSSRPPSSQ